MTDPQRPAEPNAARQNMSPMRSSLTEDQRRLRKDDHKRRGYLRKYAWENGLDTPNEVKIRDSVRIVGPLLDPEQNERARAILVEKYYAKHPREKTYWELDSDKTKQISAREARGLPQAYSEDELALATRMGRADHKWQEELTAIVTLTNMKDRDHSLEDLKSLSERLRGNGEASKPTLLRGGIPDRNAEAYAAALRDARRRADERASSSRGEERGR